MEIYKELNSPKNKEFETLLNSQLSKTKIQEGNVVAPRTHDGTYYADLNPIEGRKSNFRTRIPRRHINNP